MITTIKLLALCIALNTICILILNHDVMKLKKQKKAENNGIQIIDEDGN